MGAGTGLLQGPIRDGNFGQLPKKKRSLESMNEIFFASLILFYSGVLQSTVAFEFQVALKPPTDFFHIHSKKMGSKHLGK